ncbi:MAG: cytochrome c oxidase subunit 3 [Planktomarina sp.]
MAHVKNHDYHILAPSLYPLIGAAGGMALLAGGVLFMHGVTPWLMLAGLAAVLYTMFAWWTQTVAENKAGDHTPVVLIGLRYGFTLFIMSEVMFFSAWFWSFFKHALYPMEGQWPPAGIETFNPWELPLINTLILLTSGAAVTWAHHALVHGNKRGQIKMGLIIGVILGILFTICQAYEYQHASFGFAGNIYGANFFMATGFHGFHVIVGTIFLTVCLIRVYKGQLSPESHLGFEAAAWYWHFVDVVWLFLFAAVYIWGG